MSTRQLRLSSVELIKKNLPRLAGKKINVVLQDKTVVLGEVKGSNPNGLSIVNGRLKLLEFTFSQISEIYFDTID